MQVSQFLNAELNRVILLSDGLANVGETNPDAIASDVHGLAKRGVSTSTMGLGDDYNEDLLEAMARSGDGNYYYIASAEQLPSILEQELQGLTATFGSAATLHLEPQGDVVVADVLNDLDVDASGQFKLPNLTFHRAAGPELLEACCALNGCDEGTAKVTPGFQLAASWVIHAVCPAWQGGGHGEEAQLAYCYDFCLRLAAKHQIRSIAFPALGTGALGFPVERAARIAFETVGQILLRRAVVGTVRFVCFDEPTLRVYEAEFQRVAAWS